MKRVKRTGARTWAGIKTPQGIAAGAAFAISGLIINWWLHRKDAIAARDFYSALWLVVLPLAGFVLLLAAYHYIDLALGPRLMRIEGGPRIETRTTDWHLTVSESPRGLVLSIASVGFTKWPPSHRWMVTDSLGIDHPRLDDRSFPRIPGVLIVPLSTALWPREFYNAKVTRGEHQVWWLVDDKEAISIRVHVRLSRRWWRLN
jgi:hypothetical protein